MPAGDPGGAPHSPGAPMIVGRVRKPQGLHGEVFVQPITDAPQAVFAPGARVHLGTTDGDLTDSPEILTVIRGRPFKDGYILRFEHVEDRAAIESWRGRYLLAETTDLPALATDEIYQHELLGLRVTDEAAGEIGTVSEVFELPQGLALEVSREGNSTLIPYRPEIVREVDLTERVIRIVAPAGLLD